MFHNVSIIKIIPFFGISKYKVHYVVLKYKDSRYNATPIQKSLKNYIYWHNSETLSYLCVQIWMYPSHSDFSSFILYYNLGY